jgi:hypothetical protein
MVACFYIQAFSREAASHNELYTATYLSEPTASVLTICIAVAASVDQAQIVRTIWRSAKRRNAIVDDDVVANIPEGQDMQIAITNIRSDSSTEEEIESLYGSQGKSTKYESSLDTQEHFELNLLF